MFMCSREEALAALEVLGAYHCGYSHKEWATFCDCKFGGPTLTGDEQTGCPELRSIQAVISKMSDDEWFEGQQRTLEPMIYCDEDFA